jgi:hypothetical protein
MSYVIVVLVLATLFGLDAYEAALACPGNCPGMEEAAGAPSSFAV